MKWSVVLDFGIGNCEQGLPHIKAQLWETGCSDRRQFTGALPPQPDLPPLYQRWQALHHIVNFNRSPSRRLDAASARLTPKPKDDRLDQNQAEFKQLCQQIQTTLNQWLSSDAFRNIDEQLRTRLHPDDTIHIIFESQDLFLQGLPWHLWRFFDHYPKAEIAIGTHDYEPVSDPASRPRSKINILAIIGNSTGIDTDKDRQLIEQLPQSEIVFLVEPDRQALDQWLWQDSGWDILFFAGHSSSSAGKTTGSISLNPNSDLSISELKNALTAAIQRGLKLAIFNSCDGLGLARLLASLNIPQIIVMREPVPDPIAQAFLKNWLQAFASGMPFYQAVRIAREKLQGWEEGFPGASWLPVVCQNPAVVPPDWSGLLGKQPPLPTTTAPKNRQEYRNRKVLLNKVQHYWIQGVLEQSILGKALVELDLEARPDTIRGPWQGELDPALGSPSGFVPETSVLERFDQLGVGRTLLILGEPGAGKTTALLSLTQTLLARAHADPEHLIPVVFNLSAWAGPKQTIADWLVQELSTKYQVPQKIGQGWIEQQQLLLMLDGLDEVSAKRRNDCIIALNQFNQSYGAEMVVCCRSKDYNDCSEQLCVQAAIALQALTPDQIQQWLTTAGETLGGLTGLKTAIAADPTLQELARSPLMLSIMALASRSIEISDLPETDQIEERRHQLFRAYIQQMFQHRGAACDCSQTQAVNWLAWLAQCMVNTSQSVFLIEAMQPTWLPTAAQRWLYGFGVRLLLGWIVGIFHLALLAWLFEGRQGFLYASIGGIIAGLVYALVGNLISDRLQGKAARVGHGLTLGLIMGTNFGIVQGMIHGLQKGLLCGLTYGLIYVLVGGITYGLIYREIQSVDTVGWSWRKAPRNAVLGLLFGVTLAFTNQPIYGVMFGLILWFILCFDRYGEVETTTVPNQGIRRSISNTLTLTLTVGIVSGGALTFMEAISNRLPVNPWAFGVVNGIIFGFASGLLGGQGSGIVCIRHLVLRLLLWWNDYTPWNYAKFLDYATARIFLKKVGGSYVFVHRLLLEHFAKL